MSGAPVLTVAGLHTTFHAAHGEVRAVDDVSLRLEPGETLGIVGESGSGKSVLGRTIMGLISDGPEVAVSGTVTLAGVELRALGPAARRALWGPEIAMVFQDPMTSLNPVKRIGKHLTETLRRHLRLGKHAARVRAVELLRQVGIPEPARRLDQYPHELSGGMRQRVVIALALSCGPKVLIADEPTTALDVTVQKQILDLLQSLSQSLRMATILISHDLGAVRGRTDRVAVMYAGHVVETSATARVFETPAHPYAEGLVGSIPLLSAAPHTLLHAISGAPPNMAAPPPGCRFAPRCRYATDTCTGRAPVLRELEDTGSPAERGHSHEVRCHFPLHGDTATPAGRALARPELVGPVETTHGRKG